MFHSLDPVLISAIGIDSCELLVILGLTICHLCASRSFLNLWNALFYLKVWSKNVSKSMIHGPSLNQWGMGACVNVSDSHLSGG